MADSVRGANSSIVKESDIGRDGLFGTLVVLFSAALIRGAIGARTTAGRIVVVVVVGAIVVGLIVAGVALRRHRTWLEISDDTVLLGRSGSPPTVLARSDRDHLRFVRRGNGRYSYSSLQSTTGDTQLDLFFYSRRLIRQTCVSHGWRFD